MTKLLPLGLAMLLTACSPQESDYTQLKRDLVSLQIALERLDLTRGFQQAPEFTQRRDAFAVTLRVQKSKLSEDQAKTLEDALRQVDLLIQAAMLDTKAGTPTTHQIALSTRAATRISLVTALRHLEAPALNP